MFFHVKLVKNLKLEPKHFGPDMAETLRTKLIREVEGSCNNRHGFIISVLEIELDNQMSGLLQEGTGMAVFHIPYKAIVFRPFKNEVVDAVVKTVTKMGFFADVGPLEVFVSTQLIPSDLKFDPNLTSFHNESHDTKIQKDTEVRLKLGGIRME